MNIAKALKVKNRLVGEIARLKEIIKRENSRREDNVSKVDVNAISQELVKNQEKLIYLKAALGQATAPISRELAALAECKSDINHWNSLPTREGTELINIGGNKDAIRLEWKATFNREVVDTEVKKLQNRINELQDYVDNFNAQSKVDYAE